jgi:hypothetical protein
MFTALSQTVPQNLMYTIRGDGFAAYEKESRSQTVAKPPLMILCCWSEASSTRFSSADKMCLCQAR